ncbi:delta1-piperideine-2-carboxylate reductase [Paracandidimonas soli]|uniref:Delta1-piperideine-2-carboxylate reductase n=3 Tax=Paracandidimonas soli TaxID=1917182 RepID=A0A4R3VHC7_9BURK|nr:Ldh family oxidoreductase [Paracandidimonas soli]TCV03119.1 delta1-piperideine-2-carboxylate reductase [Paracandidimonas soli]
MNPSSCDTYNAIVAYLESCAANDAPCHMSAEQLTSFLVEIFERAGAASHTARILARTCALAEQDGAKSHGLYRVPAYIATLGTDWVDGAAAPEVVTSKGATVVIDARNGFAQCALQVARPLIEERARVYGVATLLVRRSHHFGALWLDVEPFARQGFVALTAVNSISHMAPHSGSTPLYGTNPLAFACPRSGHDPIVFDQASSLMAKGDLQLAALHGEQVPLGTGVDKHGKLTQDPHAILAGGALLPFGGHKGSSIAMMIEILAAGLTGGAFSWEIDRSEYPDAHTSRAGQFLLCIDPSHSAGPGFTGRIESLVQALHDSGQQRLPGDRRYAIRKQAATQGIAVSPQAMLDLIQAL